MDQNNRYYKAEEEITLRYYQVPKVLFGNERYKGLSLGAKMTYGILQDRLQLSIKNGWVDEQGYIFLVFDVEKLAELAEADRTTVMRYKKELVKYGLIVDKRLGQGKPNRIYVLKPELSPEQPNDNNQTLDMTEKSQNATSRNRKMQLQEVAKYDPNDTEFIDTERMNNGWLGETASPSQSYPDQIEYEWNLFKDLCEKHGINKADSIELWKAKINYYPTVPITATLNVLREMMNDKLDFKGNEKEYRNLAGLFHHRMKGWRALQVALDDVES